MSETKFTPGPWKMYRNGYVLSEETGERVCTPHSTLPEASKVSDHIKDLKANARLIAAAPELYEALEDASDLLDRMGYLSSEFREVLAKARGEQ